MTATPVWIWTLVAALWGAMALVLAILLVYLIPSRKRKNSAWADFWEMVDR
ncbi:MAG: hypothetical protein JRN68_06665 [Nitrososphaerota archaeon]|nr:hypothetical protein [Nitrososphaerota archaeon]